MRIHSPLSGTTSSNLHYMRIDGESNTNDFLSTSGTETSVLGEKDHLRLLDHNQPRLLYAA